MVDALTFLTSLTLILIAGLIALSLSKKLKIPLPLSLFAVGLILGNIIYLDRPVVQLSGVVLGAFSIIALIVVLFDSVSRIRFHDFDKSMHDTLMFFAVALIVNVAVISFASRLFFGFQWFSSVILSLLLSCVEYNAIFPKHHLPNERVAQLIKNETSLSCAFILLIPFLIINFLVNVNLPHFGSLLVRTLPIVTDLFAGIGAGLLISLILFKLLNSTSLDKSSSFLLSIGLMVAYLVAEQIGGNGLVAVTTVGFIFGNIFVRQKRSILSQENMIYSIIELLMFVVVGIVVGLPVSLDFYRLSFGLFLIYLIIRFIASNITLGRYDFYERLEVALFAPKGLATITAAFALLNYSFFGVVLLVQVLLAFFVYSLVLDSVLEKFGFYKHR